MPVDEPDGRQQAEPAEKKSPAAEESQKRPGTLKITSDGEDSLQTESISGVTDSSTMNGISPLQQDLTTTVETEEEIISFVNARVNADFKKIRGKVLFRSDLPRNTVGKLLRRDMREWAEKEATKLY